MNYPIVIGDYHLHNFQQWGRQKVDGINYRAAMSLASLKITLDRQTNTNNLSKTFIFAGDVFDTSKPEPALIAALMDLLGSFDQSQFYLMTGNHDVGSSGPNDHSLAPFKYGPKNIHVVDKPMVLPRPISTNASLAYFRRLETVYIGPLHPRHKSCNSSWFCAESAICHKR